jgi:hypothetical protein
MRIKRNNRSIFAFPTGLMLNYVTAGIFRRKLKKQGVRMTKKQARRLIRGIRKYRRHHKEWCLVEVIRENGDTFGIKI